MLSCRGAEAANISVSRVRVKCYRVWTDDPKGHPCICGLDVELPATCTHVLLVIDSHQSLAQLHNFERGGL